MASADDILRMAWQYQRAGQLPQAEALCRQALQARPNDAEAWHLLGVLAYQANNSEAALQCLERAIELNPFLPAYHCNLGLAQHAAGKLPAARESLERALNMRANQPEAHNNLGNVLKDMGLADQAIGQYRRAIELLPSYSHAHANLANALHALGRSDEALAGFQRALELAPQFAEAHNNYANVLKDLGRNDEALAEYRRAIELLPNYAEAYNNVGVLLETLGRHVEAEAVYRRAIELRPQLAAVHNNLATTLRALGRPDDALESCRAALALQPQFPEALNSLGVTLEAMGRLDEAEAALREAVRLRPQFVEGHTNLGNVLRGLGRLDEAVDACQQAIAVRRDDPEALSNLGPANTAAGKAEQPVAGSDRPLAKDSLYADAHWNRALAWLQMGDFRQGWKEYEWRWRRSGARPREMSQPLWDGQPLRDRTLLVHTEQGLGDTLQFIRYVPLVAERGGKVIVECPASLTPLLGDADIAPVVPRGEPLPDHDVHLPLLSLPRIFDTTLETVPATVPYLKARPDRVAAWRKILHEQQGFRVGIAWRGSAGYGNDRFRSLPLEALVPLGRVPNVRLFNLQKGAGEELERLRDQLPIVDLGPEFDAEHGAFVDTAAVMQSLDLVIAADTAPVHLAGALGVRVWLMLCAAGDWRWMLHREDSPWYPSLRIFRQQRLGDWPDVIERIAAELERSAKSQ